MITKQDENTVDIIIKYIDKQAMLNDSVDWKKVHWIETLCKLVDNLKIAQYCYKYADAEDIDEHYYTAECDKCGWWGSSKFLSGGGQIGDTGDHNDCYCPICGNVNIYEKDELI